MTAFTMADQLEEYVDMELIADGTGKSLLEKAFASIDDDNAEYIGITLSCAVVWSCGFQQT